MSKNIWKISKRMTVQIKSHVLDFFETSSIISSLCIFKLACEIIGTHEGAAIWLCNSFIKKLKFAVFNTSLASKYDAQTRMPSTEKSTKLTTYPQVVNYLLHTYTTHKNIADIGDKITVVTEPLNETLSQHTEELVVKALQYGDVFEQHDLNEILTEGLDIAIRQSIRGYRAKRQSAGLHYLAFYTTSVLKLQGGKHESSNSQGGGKFRNGRAVKQSCGKPVKVITLSITGLISNGQKSWTD